MNRALGRRRSLRLGGWDYFSPGAYFVTVCAKGRECLFGEMVDGGMRLNGAGRMVESAWAGLPRRFSHVELDAFVVMPNHLHGIVLLTDGRRGESRIRPSPVADGSRSPDRGHHEDRGDREDRPYGTLPGTLGRIVQAFKSITAREYTLGARKRLWPALSVKLWQRNYHEHIIRGEEDLAHLREYIALNPARWAEDEENPFRTLRDT